MQERGSDLQAKSAGGLGGPSSGLRIAGAAMLVAVAVLLFLPATWRALDRALAPPAPPSAPVGAAAAVESRRDAAPVAPQRIAEAPSDELEDAVLDDIEDDEEIQDDAPPYEFVESPYGVPGGIAAFPKMGTQPLMVGLVVPDDYEVPEGFVKHYQVTDDGETLQPILMFHPDYELLEANGEPIPLPSNRVVPKELAPEGLPIELIDLPIQQE